VIGQAACTGRNERPNNRRTRFVRLFPGQRAPLGESDAAPLHLSAGSGAHGPAGKARNSPCAWNEETSGREIFPSASRIFCEHFTIWIVQPTPRNLTLPQSEQQACGSRNWFR